MATIGGDGGNNDLVGTNNDDSIYGLGGNDTLSGLSGDDYLSGGDGGDFLIGRAGNDTLNGGNGTDEVLYYRETGPGGVIVNLETGQATDTYGNTDTLTSIERVYGTSQGDNLTGRESAGDLLNGREGNDTINGAGGNDTLVGGAGRDDITGGAGSDLVAYSMETGTGGVSVDLLAGTATDSFGNTDTLNSIEYVLGTNNNDILLGTNVDGDRLFGEGGDDYIDGRDGKNLIYTGDGDDRVIVGTTQLDARDTVVINGRGDKIITGTGALGSFYAHHLVFENDSAVTVNLATGIATADGMTLDFSSALFFLELGGTSFDDHLIGGNPRHDYLEWFVGNQGNDTIDGGSGEADTVNYEEEVERGSFSHALGRIERGTQGVVVDLALGTATDSFGDTDTLINIDDVRGTKFGDRVTGSAGANSLWGLEGNDTFHGGDGIDGIFFGEDYRTGGTAGAVVDLGAGTATDGFGDTDTLISVENAHGSEAGDDFTGSNVENRLVGWGGNDTMDGGFGNDILLGGEGDDSLMGGGNDDELWGDEGNDFIDGGAGGADLIRYINATSAVTANLTTGVVNDGLGFTDTVINVENVHGSDFDDGLTGNSAANRLAGFLGDDSLRGNGGNDILLGGDGNDDIQGGDGVDEIWGELGDDTIDGGAGSDVVRYRDALAGIQADLVSGLIQDGSGGTDVVSNVERVHGSDHNDAMFGDAAANQLQAFAGEDTLSGGGGDDVLVGGDGGDSYFFFAGDAVDTINDLGSSSGGADTAYVMSYRSENANVVLRNPADPTNKTIVLDFGADKLVLVNTLDGSDPGAIERVVWGDGEVWDQATLVSKLGQVLVPASTTPTSGDDALSGTPNADTIAGQGGNDIITGRDGDDRLQGDSGNDTMHGGAGDDTLEGGSGNDSMSGGTGVDHFVLALGMGQDTVTDYDGAVDVLDMSALSASEQAAIAVSTDGDGNEVRTLSDGSSITLIAAPVNHGPTGAVTISGTVEQNATLTAETGTIEDFDGLGTLQYQWRRDGEDISGATGKTFRLTQADVGAEMSVQVRYTDGRGTPESLTSDFTAAVANVNDGPLGAPVVSGTPTEGQSLLANVSSISDLDGLGAFSYEWLRDGTPIDGATGGSYTLTHDDIGATVRVRVSYTDGQGTEESLTSTATSTIAGSALELIGTPGNDVLTANGGDDTLRGLDGNDRLVGLDGNDLLEGGDGADILNGGEGDDTIIGGETDADLRDVVYGGAGNDSIDGSYGNDLLFGMAGDDTLAGGFGADDLQGQDGNDVITGSAYADMVFGGAGDDFVNGGFGHDLINGGTGADKFFHVGVLGHGSDWVQDYTAAEGDIFVFGNGAATADDFQVNFTHTATKEGERSGNDDVQEAFVIYKPTGQILWALVDGAGQDQIFLQIGGGDAFDLLA